MRKLLWRLWYEEAGSVASPEWALIATILVLGAITGVVASQQISLIDVDDPLPAQVR
jgi:hypothetical protein